MTITYSALNSEVENEPTIVETLEEAAYLLEADPNAPILIDSGYFVRNGLTNR